MSKINDAHVYNYREEDFDKMDSSQRVAVPAPFYIRMCVNVIVSEKWQNYTHASPTCDSRTLRLAGRPFASLFSSREQPVVRLRRRKRRRNFDKGRRGYDESRRRIVANSQR